MIQLGEFALHPMNDGFFRLDGGAMFGVVPRVLWKRRTTPDRSNRIKLGLRTLLVRTPNGTVLIDTGIGRRDDAKFRKIYGVTHRRPGVLARLAEAGVRPEEITTVVLTHLHFDHNGGSTMPVEGGRYVPTFPKARYVVQRGEWDDATHPTERTTASYLPESFLPLEEARKIDFVDGEAEIAPGIRVARTGGHTRCHQIVLLESGGRKAVYWGDLIPTTAHVDYPYIMGYDLYPTETLAQKRAWMPRAVGESWLQFWEHDPLVAAGTVYLEGGRLRVRPVGG